MSFDEQALIWNVTKKDLMGAGDKKFGYSCVEYSIKCAFICINKDICTHTYKYLYMEKGRK